MKNFKLVYNSVMIVIMILGLLKLSERNYFLAFVWIIITPLLMLLPRNLYKINYIKDNYNYSLVYFFELMILILLFTSVGFTLGIKEINIDFDSFSHFLNLTIYTLLVGIIYYIFRSYELKKPNKIEVMLFALIFTFIFGVILWEKFQFYGDQIFGTHMFYDKFQNIELDSFLDQIFGSIGVVIGSTILYNKIESWMKGWKK